MHTSPFLLAAFVFIVVVWAAASIWRDYAADRWHDIERAYVTYYAAREGGQTNEMRPPVRWDFERNQLVEIPQGEYTVEEFGASDPDSFAMGGVLVKESPSSKPAWTWGFILGRIPPVWFHGFFAALTLVIGLLAAGIQRGGGT